MKITDTFQKSLDTYIDTVQTTLTRHIKDVWNGKEGWEDFVEVVGVVVGSKYIKVVRSNRSVYGFIKIEDGSLWKAAGWKGPERNFSRGNLFDETTWNVNPYSIG